MQTIKARIAADHPDMAEVASVTVFGQKLTQDHAEIEVSDEVLAKLKGNPAVEVLVRKARAAAEPKPEPTPEPPAEPEPQPQG